MAKASSPVRLQSELMQAAAIVGQRMHRSTAEQIEYWAALGRSVSNSVNPDNLLAVTSGLAQLKVIPINAPTIDPDDVFASIERDRSLGRLSESVTDVPVKYQASVKYPGQLEQVSPDGTIIVGQFSMGKFTPMELNQ